MKKKLWALVLAAVTVSSLVGCGKPAEAPTAAGETKTEVKAEDKGEPVKTQTWRMAFNQTEEHPQYRVMQEFSDSFKERTGGRYEIKLFPNETLGNQRETLEQVQAGTIEMSIVNNTHPGSVSDYFKTFDIPFVFDDIDGAIKFMLESPVMEEVKKDTEQFGFNIATYLPAGVRSMYTVDQPIKSAADMKALKIRTMESDTYVKMMTYLGGNATPMAMGELYTAIQSGVVDGAENNEITYVNSKHYEVAPYWSETKHLIVPDWLIINHDTYASLSEEDRAIFDEEAKIAVEKVSKLWNEDVEKLMATLADKNVTITKDVDTESFKQAVLPLHEELTSSNEKIKKVYDAIQAMK
ncbi:MAG: C4-dicarboxylate transporter substrate-binding protein [Clostridia bacterium]|jgi:tripartite ATP-independent transporter DctP family solute receptor|nr:C4-dicarboxylate transporter substrate-binding protein [Clostridia bacterium]